MPHRQPLRQPRQTPRTLLACATLALCGLAQAQAQAQAPAQPTTTPPATAPSSSVTLYGSLDQYLQHMRSSSGAQLTSLNDGAILRSRIGLRGTEDLGGGMAMKFTLEHGLFADRGTQADSTRFFDRQAWLGLAMPHGEIRVGRQNTVIFTRSEFIDYSGRTLASTANHFGQPARLDNDIAYISPRVNGVLFEAHFAPGEQATGGPGSKGVWQVALDYLDGPWRVGYAGLRARPPSGAVVNKTIAFDNLYLNHDWGQGKVYLTFIRSNFSTRSSNVLFGNNAGSILGATGALVAGDNTDARRFHNVVQVSADWRVSSKLRVGGLVGRINDTSSGGQDATGGSVGGFYDLSRRTTLYTAYEVLNNARNAGFILSGSAPVLPNFSAADVNGERIQALQLGIVHRF